MKYKILYLLVFLYCCTISAQNCTITFSGKVEDFHENSTLEAAVVQIVELNKFTTTDKNGAFSFKNLCTGNFTIEISHIACETKQLKINLKENLYKEISLEHHLEELNEVVVKSNTKLEKTSIQQSVKKNVIEKFTDKSLGDALNTISGVSSLTTGNTVVKPMIHGLHSSRLLIINNNVRMFDQEWGDEHAPNIDINSSGRIDVIKGANSLIYGSDAIGGLILIRPENYTVKDSLFGNSSISFNTNGLGGNVNSELVKTYKSGLYAKAQASYKLFGDFNSPNYNLSNTGVKNINASAKIGYKSFEKGFDAYYSFVNNNLGILRAAHIGNISDLVQAIESQEPNFIDDFSYKINQPKQEITHHLGKIEAYKRFKGLGKLKLQYDFQVNRRKEFDVRRGALRNKAAIDLKLFTTSLQSNLKIDALRDLKFNTGLLARYQQNDAISGTGARQLIPDYDKYDFGIYTTATYHLDLFSEISVGFRYDFSHIEAEKKYRITDWDTTYNYDELFPEFNTGVIDGLDYITKPKFTFHNISTSLGYIRHLSNDFELAVNYGLASRMPNPSELFSDGLHHSAARIEIGNLGIKKEVANKILVSLERKNRNFGFSINPYYRYIKDYIQLIPVDATTTIRGSFVEWEYKQVNAHIFGVDIDINKKINTNFNYKGSLSLLKGDNLTDNIPLIYMPATNFSNTITYYNKALNQLSIGINQKTILQQNSFPDYNFSTFNPVLQQDVFVDISSTPPTYTLFNLNTSAVFNTGNNRNLKVEFNVENLFNTSYREHLNRLRYFADDVGRNFNIKLKYNY